MENINISKAVYEPIVYAYTINGQLFCLLKNSIPNSDIYFTIDNTYPVNFGLKYKEPIFIPNGDFSLRTQTFINGKPIGRTLIISREELEKRAKM